MKYVFALLVVCNLIDTVSTSYVLSTNSGVEYNPLVRLLFGWHPVAFFIAKVAVVLYAAAAIADDGIHKHKVSLTVVAAFYFFLSMYQVAAIAYGEFH